MTAPVTVTHCATAWRHLDTQKLMCIRVQPMCSFGNVATHHTIEVMTAPTLSKT